MCWYAYKSVIQIEQTENKNKNVYNTYSNVPYHLRSDIFESEQILVSNSVFVKILGGFCSMSYSV